MSTGPSKMKFPPVRTCPFHLPAEYDAARQSPELLKAEMWDGTAVLVATRYDDVKGVLRNPSMSSVPTNPGFPFISSALKSQYLRESPSLQTMDPPEQTRFRKMFAPKFSIPRVNGMRSRVQEIVDETIDKMMASGNAGDLVEEFALPVPSRVIAELLGVPYEDHGFFQEVARRRMDMSAGADVGVKAGQEIADYLTELVKKRLTNPEGGQDLITQLVVEQVAPGHLEIDQLVVMARLLLQGGHETTSNMIALGVLTLLRYPEHIAAIQQSKHSLQSAIEELLRYWTIPQFQSPRTALADIEVNGHSIPAGQGVFALINAANHDPSVFTDPEKFDIDRKEISQHIAFGEGPHQCLGQSLARMEMEVVFSTIFKRLPKLALGVPVEELNFKDNARVFGLKELPVTW